MARYVYVESDNSTSDAQVLGEAGRDIIVKRVVFGNPDNGDILRFYNKRVAPGHASGIGSVSDDGLALEFIQETAGAGKDHIRNLELNLQLDGGSFHTDGDNITVEFDYADESPTQ